MSWKRTFTYDRASGRLIWKKRPLSAFETPSAGVAWNSRFAGTPAGAFVRGAWRVCVEYHVHRVAKIIWEMHHKPIKHRKEIVCFADGDGRNTRIENLILRTSSTRQMVKGRPPGISGVKGVYKYRGKHRAAITIDGKLVHLGTFPSPELAAKAYKKAVVVHRPFL